MGYKFRLSFVLLFFCVPFLLFADNTLIFAIDVIRHGDRTPIVFLPTVNYEWKEGPGQLTAEGMQQEYKLGVEFRKKYIMQSHLLPEHYEYGTIYVRSTGYDRTLMSAESLLMGLYPHGTGPNSSETSSPALPHAFQPIPIFSAPAKYDDMILPQLSNKERAELLEQFVYGTKEWQQQDNDLKDKYPIWSRILGVQINGLADLHLLADALFVHQVHHAPMPEGLSATDMKTIIDAANWSFMAQARPKQIANAYGTKLMTHIANYLNNGSLHTSKLKYVLISAHDSTIATVLSFLGSPLESAPPYASYVNFSLYESGPNYYTVAISYNGQPVSIPACGGDVCELHQFIKLVSGSE